jgi:hypothetical protein
MAMDLRLREGERRKRCGARNGFVGRTEFMTIRFDGYYSVLSSGRQLFGGGGVAVLRGPLGQQRRQARR